MALTRDVSFGYTPLSPPSTTGTTSTLQRVLPVGVCLTWMRRIHGGRIARSMYQRSAKGCLAAMCAFMSEYLPWMGSTGPIVTASVFQDGRAPGAISCLRSPARQRRCTRPPSPPPKTISMPFVRMEADTSLARKPWRTGTPFSVLAL